MKEIVTDILKRDQPNTKRGNTKIRTMFMDREIKKIS